MNSILLTLFRNEVKPVSPKFHFHIYNCPLVVPPGWRTRFFSVNRSRLSPLLCSYSIFTGSSSVIPSAAKAGGGLSPEIPLHHTRIHSASTSPSLLSIPQHLLGPDHQSSCLHGCLNVLTVHTLIPFIDFLKTYFPLHFFHSEKWVRHSAKDRM